MKLHLYTGCLALYFLFVRVQVVQTTTAAPGAHPQQESGGTTATPLSGTEGETSDVEAEARDLTQVSSEAETTQDGLPAQNDHETAAAGEDLTASFTSTPMTHLSSYLDPQDQIIEISETTPTVAPEHQQVTPASSPAQEPTTGEGAESSEVYLSIGEPTATAHEDSGAFTSATATQHITTAAEHSPTSSIHTATSAPFYSTGMPSPEQATTTVTATSAAGASEVVHGAIKTQVVCHWSAAELAYCLAVLVALSLIQMVLLTLCVYRVASRSHRWEPTPIQFSKSRPSEPSA